MAVTYDEVEVSLLQEMVFHAAHDRGRIAVTDFGHDDADGKAALGAQRTSKKVWAIFIFASGGENAIFGFLGNGIGDGRTIDDER